MLRSLTLNTVLYVRQIADCGYVNLQYLFAAAGRDARLGERPVQRNQAAVGERHGAAGGQGVNAREARRACVVRRLRPAR